MNSTDANDSQDAATSPSNFEHVSRAWHSLCDLLEDGAERQALAEAEQGDVEPEAWRRIVASRWPPDGQLITRLRVELSKDNMLVMSHWIHGTQESYLEWPLEEALDWVRQYMQFRIRASRNSHSLWLSDAEAAELRELGSTVGVCNSFVSQLRLSAQLEQYFGFKSRADLGPLQDRIARTTLVSRLSMAGVITIPLLGLVLLVTLLVLGSGRAASICSLLVVVPLALLLSALMVSMTRSARSLGQTLERELQRAKTILFEKDVVEEPYR